MAAARRYRVIGARGGSGLSGGRGGGTKACGGSGGGGDGDRSPSSIFLEQPLEREFTPCFLQMTAKVCWGVPSPLIEPIMGQEGKGLT